MPKIDVEYFSPRKFALTGLLALAACGGVLPVASVTIGPPSPSVFVGSTLQLVATTTDANGAEVSGSTVSWSSNDQSIVTVTSSGLASGVAVGSATISATSAGKIGTATFTVLPLPVESVTVTPASPSVEADETVQLAAETRDANGTVLTGRTVTWSSNSPSASVSSAGLVSGSSAGTATITATSEGKTGTATVTVTPRVIAYEYYKLGGTATPATATLTLPNGSGGTGTLSIDGRAITGISGVACPSGGPGGEITSCAGLADPHTMRLCGPATPGGANVLLYVLFDSPDPNRIANTSTALLAALQTDTGYLGIGVYPGCGATFTTSWIRNYPNTNYYYWPDVFTTYTPGYVSGLLSGAVIYSTPTPGNDYTQFVAVRVSSGVFEVWH